MYSTYTSPKIYGSVVFISTSLSIYCEQLNNCDFPENLQCPEKYLDHTSLLNIHGQCCHLSMLKEPCWISWFFPISKGFLTIFCYYLNNSSSSETAVSVFQIWMKCHPLNPILKRFIIFLLRTHSLWRYFMNSRNIIHHLINYYLIQIYWLISSLAFLINIFLHKYSNLRFCVFFGSVVAYFLLLLFCLFSHTSFLRLWKQGDDTKRI